MHEGPREGDQPDEREEDGYARDDLGVDEAAMTPARRMANQVQVLAIDACDNGSKHQLRDAEDDGRDSS